jgi:hypothetical protein
MSKLQKAIAIGAFSTMLAACTTVTKPVSPSSAASVPPVRLYAFQHQKSDNDATLVVTRDKGFGCYTAFYINGKLAARFDDAETAKFYVKPGAVLLRYGRDPKGKALCGIMQDHWASHETTLQPGETKQFRLTIVRGGEFKIQRGK